MNGLHIPGTPMVVDYWKTKNLAPRMLFFLTHMHADHTSGLNSSWPYPIHCTPVTGKLLQRKFNIRPNLIVELKIGEPVTLMVSSPRCHDRVFITVTTIDANHCPGAAMFLFDGYFGRILYTGDFRYSPSMESNLHLSNSKRVDVLYLDNTYCDPSCIFATREKAVEKITSLIQRSSGSSVVYLGLHKLGKEELLVEIATSLGCRIGVDQEKMELFKLLELPDVFDTDMDACWIRVCPFHILAKNYWKAVQDENEEALGILPTALYSGDGAPPPPPHVEVVAYSDHSSFAELRQFVEMIKPCCVRPIVRSFTGDKGFLRSSRTNMAVFNDLLDMGSDEMPYNIPPVIKDLLSTKSTYLAYRSQSAPYNIRSSINSHKHLRIPKSRLKGIQYISPSKSQEDGNHGETDLDSQSDDASDSDFKLRFSSDEDGTTINPDSSAEDKAPDKQILSDFSSKEDKPVFQSPAECAQTFMKEDETVFRYPGQCARTVPIDVLTPYLKHHIPRQQSRPKRCRHNISSLTTPSPSSPSKNHLTSTPQDILDSPLNIIKTPCDADSAEAKIIQMQAHLMNAMPPLDSKLVTLSKSPVPSGDLFGCEKSNRNGESSSMVCDNRSSNCSQRQDGPIKSPRVSPVNNESKSLKIVKPNIEPLLKKFRDSGTPSLHPCDCDLCKDGRAFLCPVAHPATSCLCQFCL